MKKIHERKRIFALLDDRLSPRGRIKLERHLEGCAGCREYLENVREARNVLAEMGEGEPGLNWASVDAAVEQASTAPTQIPGAEPWRKWALGTALAAATAALVLVVAYRFAGTDEGPRTPAPNGEVEVRTTLLDSVPQSGRLTVIGEGTKWKRPGLGWQPADLDTVISGDTDIETTDTSVASVQVASLSGFRIEPSTRATFGRITRESVHVDLEEGRVSLQVHQKSGLRDVRVNTSQASIRIRGTTLSVEKSGPSTRVVVAKGRATVEPAGGGEAHVLEAPATVRVDADGVHGAGDLPADAEAKTEIQRLRSLHFNFFEGDLSDSALAFAPQNETGDVTISFGDKIAGIAPLTMLAPSGQDEALLAFQDGSTLEMPLKVEPAATTVVAFTAPVIKTEPTKGKTRVASKTPKEQAPAEVQEEPEAEEPQHTGILDKQIVRMVFKKHFGRLRSCYEKYLDRGPETGIVQGTITFTVGTSGKVTEASASTSGDKKLDACLAGATYSVKFPPPSGGTVEFQYPVKFK